MGKDNRNISRRIAQSSLAAEAVPGQPIVEITGDKRVLIECHRGVLAYSRERIQVSVGYGWVCVCGCDLELIHMTREKLIIYGRITSIQLHRR